MQKKLQIFDDLKVKDYYPRLVKLFDVDFFFRTNHFIFKEP